MFFLHRYGYTLRVLKMSLLFALLVWADSSFAQQWGPWREVPGGGTTSLPDTAAGYDNRLYLFSIGNNGRHYVNVLTADIWRGWREVPGGGTTSLPDAAAVYNDSLYLFSIGNNGRHYVNVLTADIWSGWREVPGGGTTSLPDAAAVSTYRETMPILFVFSVGNDGRHYVNVLNGSWWRGWSEVPGGGITPVADNATALHKNVFLFSIGYDGRHYYTRFGGTPVE